MFLRVFIAFVVTVSIAFIVWKGFGMGKEIQSQEIIPLDKGIAVVNGGSKFLNDKLQILLKTDNGIYKKMSYDNRGICLFRGLSNQRDYSVEIRRTDLKGMLLYKNLKIKVTPRESGTKYFVLVGASVGKDWDFEKLPQRLRVSSDIVFGYRTKYAFDKSDEINALVSMPVPVTGVIIKECAAYFPRDISESQKLINDWVKILSSHSVTPILATVAPVTKEHDVKHPGRFASLLAFNDFIRDYASREGLLVLDLEKALRVSDEDRHLKNEYAQPDGLHLVEKAYCEALDGIVLPILTGALTEDAKGKGRS